MTMTSILKIALTTLFFFALDVEAYGNKMAPRYEMNETVDQWYLQLYDSVLNNSLLTRDTRKKLSCLDETTNMKCCSCTWDCMRLKDCCLDWYFAQNLPLPPQSYLKRFLDTTKQSRKICSPVLPFVQLQVKHKVEKLMMIADCPMFVTASKLQCENPNAFLESLFDYKYLIPVLGNDQVVYKNKFCAICNGISNFSQLQIKYSNCESHFAKKTFSNESKIEVKQVLTKMFGCEISALKRLEYGIQDKEKIYQSCNVGRKYEVYNSNLIQCTEEEFQLCHSYVALTKVASTNEIYNNPTCIKCYLGNAAYHFSSCVDDYRKLVVMKNAILTSFSVLISFSERVNIQVVKVNGEKASDENIQVYAQMMCKKSETYNWLNEQCEADPCKSPTIADGSCPQTRISRINKKIKYCSFPCPKSKCLEQIGPLVIASISLCHHIKNKTKYVMIGQLVLETRVFHCIKGQEVAKVANHTTKDILTALQKHQGLELQILLFQSHHNLHAILSKRETCSQVMNMKAGVNCECSNSKPCTSNTNIFYELVNGNWTVKTCINEDNRSIQYSWEGTLDFIGDLISICLLAISIVANLVTVTIHLTVNELRSVSGGYMIAFILTVLAIDITVLVGAVGKVCAFCCKIIAVLLHWFSLASQLWTLIIIYDLAKTMRRLTRFRYVRHRFLIRNVIVWSSASSIVLVCVLLDQFHGEAIQYGRNGVCWIGNYYAHIASYSVPTLLVMIMNLAILFVVFLKKRVVQREENPLSAQNTAQYAKIMGKIVLLFGTLEIIGLFQVGESNESLKLSSAVVRLLYSIIRSSKGFFVFIALVLMSQLGRKALVKCCVPLGGKTTKDSETTRTEGEIASKVGKIMEESSIQ